MKNYKRIRVGDLVEVRPRAPNLNGTKGFTSCPAVYGYHTSVWAPPGVGIVTGYKDTYFSVAVHGQELWFQIYALHRV